MEGGQSGTSHARETIGGGKRPVSSSRNVRGCERDWHTGCDVPAFDVPAYSGWFARVLSTGCSVPERRGVLEITRRFAPQGPGLSLTRGCSTACYTASLTLAWGTRASIRRAGGLAWGGEAYSRSAGRGQGHTQDRAQSWHHRRCWMT